MRNKGLDSEATEDEMRALNKRKRTRTVLPYFFDNNLKSERNLNLVQTNVTEDLSLVALQQMFVQQDDAQAISHNAHITKFLNAEFTTGK